LAFVADAYAIALAVNASLFPDSGLVAQIVEQLNHKKLADEDIDLLLCLYHLIGRGFEGNPEQLRTPSFYQSVFVDEVQDFTEQQIYLMVEQARPEYFAVTLVGDIAQKLHNGSSIDVRACFPGKSLQHVQLSKNMRQAEAPGMAWFSARFRAELQGGLLGEIPDDELLNCLLETPNELYGPELETYSDEAGLVEQTVKLLQAARTKQTVAVILPDAEIANRFYAACKPALAERMVDAELSERIDLSRRHVRHFTAITNAKGLEFDLVILPYFERYDLTNTQHINRMYVALTRARQRLVLISHATRPASALDHVWQQYQDILAMA
jgi:DNA helicase IV